MPTKIAKIKRTSVIALPSLFTVGNMAFGFFSILNSFHGNFLKAGWFILGAMVLDMLDGRIARMLKAESSFGVEMDSLADFLSFSIAPAILMYFFALKSYPYGAMIAFIYTLFGALRLAKFNVLAHSGNMSKIHFSGLPTPAGAGILASFAISYTLLQMGADKHTIKWLANYMPTIYNVIALVMLLLSVLMVSNIKYAAFKGKSLLKPRNIRDLVFLIILVFVLIKYPQDIIFLVFCIYVIVGIIAIFYRIFRKMDK
ncbi:MAG: CDP-diacylglycerol--serine O-phosphatidyltransferase [Elusimicrobiaceae bacterium]|jgi:CDP-diacylglycerol---serine O-phosphatidyltransferase|nr:CDP-diacylglycerol--serine O-phosphatidyltransferase [Elusimicrobiaceae bacterium]MBT3954870.1 CDP-diacylglycerol--serine O-phosphatidyltransferase [Elusimicrobiaceae bacterium]MBT4008383.1 CDP-diacylglycerol--serine O-phosphatidyltransferase [Elusimicrobiaceae bacterium]MBT4403226.1 CDP-diacylglycerol--serine O-phosphatidyltransferase [Elusimicrobiaceae bacterium]MBT4439436.1 CDP-diacylglycerol--serine O-phosphatidyltransferase [Elusimicrobiaceae bacterium]